MMSVLGADGVLKILVVSPTIYAKFSFRLMGIQEIGYRVCHTPVGKGMSGTDIGSIGGKT
jgi:hypothetical protein